MSAHKSLPQLLSIIWNILEPTVKKMLQESSLIQWNKSPVISMLYKEPVDVACVEVPRIHWQRGCLYLPEVAEKLKPPNIIFGESA